MRFSTNAALAALLGLASAAKDERTFAVLRFTNKQLTKARADPIVTPGKVSGHVHGIMGGSNFNLGSTGEDLVNSKCSNAMVKGDNSNYWFPMLYFKDPKTGEFEDVEIFYVNAYYFFEPTNDDIKAFPLGMSMVTGDASTRIVPSSGASSNMDPSKGPINAVKWTCPRDNNNYDPPSWPADSTGKMAGVGDDINKGEGVGFPDMDCNGYASPLRADMHFPSCYNPEAGLTAHTKNMAWPSDAGDGKLDCPKGYIHVPHLFIEVYWNTPAFSDRWTQGKGDQPFVLANGDATGFSSHGDFMSGWDEKLLQHIIDTCDTGTGGMDKCPGLFYGLNEGDCTIPPPVDEKVTGVLSALPGNNAVEGWKYGTTGGGGNDNGSDTPSSSAAAPGASTKPTDDETSTKAPDSKPTKGAASTKTPASPASSEAAASKPSLSVPVVNNGGYGDSPATTDAAVPESTKVATTALAASASASVCKPKTHTVYNTVTVTAGMPAPSSDAAANSTDSVSGFKYAGCFKDTSDRVLDGKIRPNLGAVSNENCVAYCKSAGFTLAGTEYGGQCYCGNELVGSEQLDDSECDTTCEGDASDTCGGGWALSVYSKDGEASMKSSKTRRHAHEHALRHRSHHR